MIVAATGHRLTRLRKEGVIDPQLPFRLRDFAARSLRGLGATSVISGMALGWDMACAHAALEIGVPFEAVVPFPGQESRWPSDMRAEYKWLLERADDVSYVAREYSPEALQRRNEVMVDRADCMAALWDGTKGGGTFNCLIYARDQKVRVHQLYQLWTDYRGEYVGII